MHSNFVLHEILPGNIHSELFENTWNSFIKNFKQFFDNAILSFPNLHYVFLFVSFQQLTEKYVHASWGSIINYQRSAGELADEFLVELSQALFFKQTFYRGIEDNIPFMDEIYKKTFVGSSIVVFNMYKGINENKIYWSRVSPTQFTSAVSDDLVYNIFSKDSLITNKENMLRSDYIQLWSDSDSLSIKYIKDI